MGSYDLLSFFFTVHCLQDAVRDSNLGLLGRESDVLCCRPPYIVQFCQVWTLQIKFDSCSILVANNLELNWNFGLGDIGKNYARIAR